MVKNMSPKEIMEIRNLLGVTQESFAHMLGTTVVTVNRWEKGKSHPLKIYIKELKKLKEGHLSYVSRAEKT